MQVPLSIVPSITALQFEFILFERANFDRTSWQTVLSPRSNKKIFNQTYDNILPLLLQIFLQTFYTMALFNLHLQQCHDIVQGSGILGACGGGLISEAMQYITPIRDAPYQPRLVPLPRLADDTQVFTPFNFGGAEDSDGGGKANDSLSRLLRVVQLAQVVGGKPLEAIVPVEAGPVNIAVVLYISAMTGLPIVDADPRGRSVPEIGQSNWALKRVPVGPVIAVTNREEEFIFRNIASDAREDSLLRAIVPMSDNRMSGADHILPVGEMREALIEGTVSKCLQIGIHLRQAPTNVARGLAEKFEGKVIFRGTVSEHRTLKDSVCSKGIVFIKNREETMQLHLFNECMYAEVHGKVVASIPEIISIVDQETRKVLLNPDFKIGSKVSVVVLPSPSPFLTPEGLELFGPKYAGIGWTFRSALK